jgi:hypothetical protein
MKFTFTIFVLWMHFLIQREISMSRTPGAKDKKPRRMVNAFPRKHAKGVVTGVVRIYCKPADLKWFCGLTALERGSLVAQARALAYLSRGP